MYSQYRGAGGGTLHYNESEALGLLQHLNKDELQQLHDDEDRMLEIIQSLQQVVEPLHIAYLSSGFCYSCTNFCPRSEIFLLRRTTFWPATRV